MCRLLILAALIATVSLVESSCVDTASNCAADRHLCNDKLWHDLMFDNCKQTCNFCDTCVDSHSNCAEYVRNGFCNSTFYTPLQKRQFCGKSCNLC
uniref:ShKT domain-containing protein n=1 Tax=Panagrellus redivivus TaxID=6233 RepID=A0A7E4W671_PANRE